MSALQFSLPDCQMNQASKELNPRSSICMCEPLVAWRIEDAFLLTLNLLVVAGNILVIFAVLADKKLRNVTTNKFIASLAVSDLLIGIVVMPLSLHSKVLSSFLSFFLPGAIVVYLYVKIFRKLRTHQLYMFGAQPQRNQDKRRSLPRVIIEEVRSRRGSRLSQTGSQGSPTRRSSGGSKERSPSQPDIHTVTRMPQRWRSPTICAETLAHDRYAAAKKRISIIPDPPSIDVSISLGSVAQMNEEHEQNKLREREILLNGGQIRKRSREEEEVRKLSEERRIKIAEKRRMSTSEAPNGVPIMIAFQKAYNEVRAGRRRSMPDYEIAYHFPSRLDTVDDMETTPGEEAESATLLPEEGSKKPSSASSMAETIIAVEKMPLKSLPKDDSHDDSVSTDASQKPLIAQPHITHYTKHKKSHLHSFIQPPTFLLVPAMMDVISTPPLTPNRPVHENDENRADTSNDTLLKVPRIYDCPSPCSVPSNSSYSSYTSASGSSDTFRRISMNSYGSSLTDNTDSTFEIDSRRSSAWSTIRAAVLERAACGPNITIEAANGGSPKKSSVAISRGKLRRIAGQVTRAIRRKRRESLAIRRESRATRVVAAILLAFLICWIPYFCVTVMRGIMKGFGASINRDLHLRLFIATSWLGYAHSCFNPIIYMCLNKNFRNHMKRLVRKSRE
ncbi:hypothetical protein WR25_03678 [Diploscapter pachys]|uniref:G-protein coupled receptors family 1 profile domain-containing protein n=1 Tax=Diploscapter pachys TaxID=2018661 RepID=A0A2A2LV96_9BILA|nr:hypothetical protein WR25_03678 [Diploscapter pachys]